MASVVNTYHCIVHFEVSGKKQGGYETQNYLIQGADNTYATLQGVLSSNSKIPPGTTVVFESITQVGVGTQHGVLA